MTEQSTLYWAEQELGTPFSSQDDAWVANRYQFGRLLGALACATTVAILAVAYARLTRQGPDIVQIALYDIDPSTVRRAAPLTPIPSPTYVAKRIPPAARRPAAALLKPAIPDVPVDTKIAVRSPAPLKSAPKVVKVRAQASPASTKLAANTAATPVTPKTPKLTMLALADNRAPAAGPVAPRPALTPPSYPAPVAVPELEAKAASSRTGEKKPTDIASGTALGIREVLADGIVMMNGRKIKNGAALPNGELLLGTDAAKGLAETDRRVMIVTH